MSIPVYVLTGFLDSGKTTFLNNLLNSSGNAEIEKLVIQFEMGENEFNDKFNSCHLMKFTKKNLDKNLQVIADEIKTYIDKCKIDEIWIEWNSVTNFSKLQNLLIHKELYEDCHIKKVMHIADGNSLKNLIGKTGTALLEQIASSDFVIARNIDTKDNHDSVKIAVTSINPGVKVYDIEDFDIVYKQIFKKKSNPVDRFSIGILVFISLYLLAMPILSTQLTHVNTVINIFIGMILQAIPFLLIGVMISSAIQVFIPQSAIENRFPKHLGLGMFTAIIAGFCLPVCDCASIPIFKSLVKKGVPMPVAVTFMTVAPVINPVVMLSTYYAFGGDIFIVGARVFLGIISAVIIGLIFAFWPSKEKLVSGGFDSLMCSCGCFDELDLTTTLKGKINLFIRHSQAEFFNVGKYLLVGGFVSSVFQTIGTRTFFANGTANFSLSLFIMMLIAFLLSLCSSSDAVIARSFGKSFSMGSVMGFLVFGPMMDIKNVIMLSGGFSNRFVGKLLMVSALVCFFVIFIFNFVLGGNL